MRAPFEFIIVPASLESEAFDGDVRVAADFTCALRTIFWLHYRAGWGLLIAIFYNEAGNGWLEREDLNHNFID